MCVYAHLKQKERDISLSTDDFQVLEGPSSRPVRPENTHTHFNTVNYRRVHSSMESKEVVCERVCVRGIQRELHRDIMNTGSNEPFVSHSHTF